MDFDPNAYLDATTTSASERRNPVPPGDYVSTIQNLEATRWQSKDKYDERTGELKSGPKFNITHSIDLPESVQEVCGIKQLIITDGIMLDTTPEGQLDYSRGRNTRLRMYREATGLNRDGEPFSPRMLVGRMIKVKITHDLWQGNVQERIGAIAALA